MATSLTGCADDPGPDNAAVCIDKATEVRVEDNQCQDWGGGGGSGGLGFFYFGGLNGGARYNVPPVGGSVRGTGGTLVRPGGITQMGGISRTGGSVYKDSPAVSRGGFGKSGGGRGFGS